MKQVKQTVAFKFQVGEVIAFKNNWNSPYTHAVLVGVFGEGEDRRVSLLSCNIVDGKAEIPYFWKIPRICGISQFHKLYIPSEYHMTEKEIDAKKKH